jgi:alpha-galactosidase
MAEHSFLDGRLTLDVPGGKLSLAVEPQVTAQGVTAAVGYRLGEAGRSLELAGPEVSFGAGENLVTFSHQDDCLRLDWNWTVHADGLEAWLEVTNQGDRSVAVDRLDVALVEQLDLPGPAADWRFYQHGWQSWSPAGVRRVGDGPFPAPDNAGYRLMHLPHGDGLRGEWVAVIEASEMPASRVGKEGGGMAAAETATTPPSRLEKEGEGIGLLFGFVTAADQLGEIVLDAGDGFRRLIAACHTDGIPLPPGGSLRSERLRVAAGPDAWSLLGGWAARLGELMHARVPDKTPSGWCSWYYYFGFNTAQDVYANLNAIRRHRLPLHLVVVDDGYQAAVGDWLTLNADRFTDMAAVAATIRREGHLPGIWTAPFGLAADSQTFAQHPDWTVRDEAGQPAFAWTHWPQSIYALDTTHPAAAAWLHDTFRTLREWGYAVFKVDFLFAAAVPGRRHDPGVTRAQALRRGLAIIRDAIGDDAFLLGCGLPLGPAVGLVDGMRIGPDVAVTWEPLLAGDLSAPGVVNALRNSIARAFTHRRLWAADPDCLLARPRGDTSQLSLYEARTLAAVIAFTGGMLLNSDRLAELPRARLDMLRQTLPPTGRAAYPLDLFEHDLPDLLVLPVERPWGRWWLAGLINWSDQTRTTQVELGALGLPPGCYHVYDQWRAQYLGQTDGLLSLPNHRPHETHVLLFKPVADRPEWLTSTFHLLGGAVEVVDVIRQKLGAQRQKLVVHVEQAGENFGRIVFAVPEGWAVLDAQVNGRRRAVNVRAEGARLVDMGFTLHDRGWALIDVGQM